MSDNSSAIKIAPLTLKLFNPNCKQHAMSMLSSSLDSTIHIVLMSTINEHILFEDDNKILCVLSATKRARPRISQFHCRLLLDFDFRLSTYKVTNCTIFILFAGFTQTNDRPGRLQGDEKYQVHR